MLRGSQIEAGNVEADVIVIGSGAGGSLAAARIAERGHEVLVLEEGPLVTREDFDQDESKLVKMMYRRGGALATDDMSIRILQGRVLGGSTTINWMNSFRTPDDVLKEWMRDFGLEEYSSEKMERHFESIEQRMNIHTVPDEEHSRQNRIILDAGKKLGIHAEACRNNSKNCIGCGKCGLGCSYDAKMDMRLTYLTDAVNSGARVFTDTKAERIKDIPGGRKQVTATVLREKKITVKCQSVVVAGGAIMTPLLLQKSGYNHRNLGKFLHLHPVAASIAVYDKEIFPTYGAPHTAHTSEWADLKDGYGVRLEPVDLEVFLAGVNTPGLGKVRRELMKKINYMGVILALTRDGVSRKSNGEVRWRRGVNLQGGRFSLRPLPSIRYRIDPEDQKHLLFGLRKSIEIHLAAGAKEVYPTHSKLFKITKPSDIDGFFRLPMGPNQLNVFSAHPTGTARMGTDQRTSVVGPNLELNNHPGIYVMDGSVLPTAPGVNPMETILAVVSRGLELADF